MPLGGSRCEACEDAYEMEIATLHLGSWRLAGFAMVAPVLLVLRDPLEQMWRGKIWAYGSLTSGLALVDAAIILFGGGAAVGWVLATVRRGMERRRFLRSD